MTIAEQIYTLVKTLPQDDANEILTFAEFIRNKRKNGVQLSFLELWDCRSQIGIKNVITPPVKQLETDRYSRSTEAIVGVRNRSIENHRKPILS